MEVPKTQQDLIRLLFEQDKQIKGLKQAVTRLETKLNTVNRKAERAHGDNRRLNEQIQVLKAHAK